MTLDSVAEHIRKQARDYGVVTLVQPLTTERVASVLGLAPKDIADWSMTDDVLRVKLAASCDRIEITIITD